MTNLLLTQQPRLKMLRVARPLRDLLIPVILLLICGSVSAQVETIVHSFGDGTVVSDGANPASAIIQASNGALYGTTPAGGAAGMGTIYEITQTGLRILHSFGDGSVLNDGSDPACALVEGHDGRLYGTTVGGGSAGFGTVYCVTLAGIVTVVHSFDDGTVPDDGASPYASLIQGSDGDFYGTTMAGGVGYGTVFKITRDGVETVLHRFADGSVLDDGLWPQFSLVEASDGRLYGTTARGGTASLGTAYVLTSSGAEAILHDFHTGPISFDGAMPSGSLVPASDGNLYGSTWEGGFHGGGTVYQLTTDGAETPIYSFGPTIGPDGGAPYGSLIQATDGNLYGTTEYGGSTGPSGDGTVFRVSITGSEMVVHSFGDGSIVNDGDRPAAALVQASDGNFYGVTQDGGSASAGTVFKLIAAPISISVSPALVGGGTPTTVTIGLGMPSPRRGLVVKISCGAREVAVLPANTVTVPEGSLSASFVMATNSVPFPRIVMVSATANGVTKTAKLTVKPLGVLSLSVSPKTVPVGHSANAVVTLNGTVQSPFTVELSTDNPAASAPESVIVQAGQNSASFTVTTNPVTAPTTVNVIASAGGSKRASGLIVKP